MTPERWHEIESLFHDARDLGEDQRAAFLDRMCGDDHSLRREVESLLRQPRAGLPTGGAAEVVAGLVDGAGKREGTALGPYVVGPLLGVGGMGEVYRAHDHRLGRDVAIKILPALLQQHPDRLARFNREARVLASLNHPHIGAIYGLEEGDGLQGLVLELVEGVTLAERLEAGPLPVASAIAHARQIVEALTAAHDKGIVHRDLKPANIKITNAGIVKVLDFGLAKITPGIDEERATLAHLDDTTEGLVLGTVPYMSPEQARGLATDNRTDIFAFGSVLYEMLTGRRAFSGVSTADVLAALMTEDPDVSQLPAATPRSVRELLHRCFEKDPAQRLANIGEALPALELAGGRATTNVALIAVSVAALVLVLAGMSWFVTREPATAPSVSPDLQAFATLRPARLTSASGFEGFLAFAPDGRTVAYSSDRSGSMEIYVEGLAGGSTAQPLTSNGRQNVQPAWSPDGQFIAYHEMADDSIWVVPSRGGTARQLSDFGSNPSWSPDGRQIAFQSWPIVDLASTSAPDTRSTIWQVSLDGRGAPTPLTSEGVPPGAHLKPAWSRVPGQVLFVAMSSGAGSNAELWRVADGGKPSLVLSHAKLSHDLVLDPGGAGLFFKARDSASIWWWPLTADGSSRGDPQPTALPLNASQVLHFTVSPDGRRLGWTAVEQTGNVWEVPLDPRGGAARTDARPLTEGVGVRYGLPSAAADGRLAIVGSRPGSLTSLFILTDRAAPTQLTTDPAGHGSPRWLPGDKEIAVISDHGEGAAFWAVDTATARERQLFALSAIPRPPQAGQPLLSGPSLAGAFSSDFTKMAIAFVHERVPNVWVAALGPSGPTGAIVQHTFEKEGGSFPSWSSDGQWLAYQCQRGSDTQICVTDGSDSERVQITEAAGQSWTGGWLEDNISIVIATRRAAVWNVARVSRLTREVRLLTRFTTPRTYVRYPRWDGAGNRVVFEQSEILGRTWSVDLPPR